MQAIADTVHKSVGFTKNCFDLFNICIMITVGLVCQGHLIGIGIGTVETVGTVDIVGYGMYGRSGCSILHILLNCAANNTEHANCALDNNTSCNCAALRATPHNSRLTA